MQVAQRGRSDALPALAGAAGGDELEQALADLLGMPQGRWRKVVIFAEADRRLLVREWISRLPTGSVHLVTARGGFGRRRLGGRKVRHVRVRSNAEREAHLESLGPVDAIIDLLSHDTASQLELWHETFLHLTDGGTYAVDLSRSDGGVFSSDWAGWLARALGGDDVTPLRTARDREFAASTREIRVSRRVIVIGKQGRHYLKLRDAEANAVLSRREPDLALRELATLPAGTLVNSGSVTSHEAGVQIEGLDTSLPYPDLHLRQYTGPISVASNALVFTGNTILPDAFRHHLEAGLRNPLLVDATTRLAHISDDKLPRTHLDGVYYHLDSENSGHFGHLMTEVVSRLWGWDAAKRANPDLKALFRTRFPGERDPVLERRLFTAYGIDAADIVWTGVSVSVDSLVAATPMWHNQVPHYVHPQIADTWRRLADGLADPDAPTYDRIFVSRSGDLGNRACRNIGAVEAYFAEHGFEIVYPELHDLAVQAGIFRSARVIAGFGGSAMFNMLYANQLDTMILLNHEAYTARNEHLFASVLGVDAHYFWSTSDVAHPPGGWTQAAYYSGWEFDFARNGADLDHLIKEL